MLAFEKNIETIQKNNEKYLKMVIDHNRNEVLDKLSNHYLLHWEGMSNGIRYRLGFNKDSYIPTSIQDEVITTFNLHFSDK